MPAKRLLHSHLVRSPKQHVLASYRSHGSSVRCASAMAVPTTSQHDTLTHTPIKEASLPNPDPAPDSPTAAILNEHSKYMVATYVRPPPMMAKGEGCYVWDIENRKYLDFTAGVAVNSLGHSDPEIAKLAFQQAKTLVHTANLYYNPWIGALSQLLIERTLASGGMRDAARAFICNSGTEANEAAIKFARKVGKVRQPDGSKTEFVSFEGSFHGRSMGALSATPNPKYQKPFAPMVPGFKYGKLNDSAGIDTLVTEHTCGVIIEPIQGEGGVNVASGEFLKKLRQRCDEVGAVLIYDEIQCGNGRTGALWAHSLLSDAHPDILTTAKALGNGFPIGATLATEEISQCITTGDHGTTFGGNPLASRLAHHIFTRLSDREFLRQVTQKEHMFLHGFHRMMREFPGVIEGIRGKGLMLALQLNRDPTPIITAARERGLLIITCGTNTLRFVPPLIITEREIEEGLGILEEAFRVVLDAEKHEGVEIQGTKGQQEMAPPGR